MTQKRRKSSLVKRRETEKSPGGNKIESMRQSNKHTVHERQSTTNGRPLLFLSMKT